MEQGTTEWLEARIGNITASRVHGIRRGKRGFYTAARKNYMAEMICEMLTGKPTEMYVSKEMEHGTEQEPVSRMAYEMRKGVSVSLDGFRLHPSIKGLGASPDGLVESDGLVEFKNPMQATHMDTMINGTVKDEYITQMNVQMMVYDRAWCDFVSHDDRFPDNLSFFCKRFYRDEVLIKEIENEVILFIAERDTLLNKLKEIV